MHAPHPRWHRLALLGLLCASLRCNAHCGPKPDADDDGVPSGDCLGFPCTAEGARAMLDKTAHDSAELSDQAEDQLGALIDAAVAKMQDADRLDADGFTEARDNLQTIFANTPDGIDDPLPRQLEDVTNSKFRLCPLWPFC